MKIYFSFAMVFMLSLGAVSSDNFTEYFGDGAIRYDFEMLGDSKSVEVIKSQIKLLQHWGGNPDYLIEDFNRGTYNYQLYDLESGQLIFQKSFGNLYGEWQTTAEAKIRKRSFYQGVFFPKPLADVVLLINERNEQNNWHSIYSDTIQMANYFIKNETSLAYKTDTLIFNGTSADKIDLVILPEGYTRETMNSFASDTRRLIDSLFMAEPFKQYKNRFNVFLVEVPSQENGTDVPGEHIYKNTAFNSHFYTFDSPRYLTTSDMKSIYDAIDHVAWDQIYVVVNTTRYGGGGFYNFLNVCTANNVRSPFVFCHEFGHGFAALGDEYYYASTAYEDFNDLSVEPWEPNLTTLVNFENKWPDLIAEGTPVPTPRDSIYNDVVGVFEGGGYLDKGIYSPVMSCWMKEAAAGKFCPVCESAIEKVILKHSK